jgi:hypothetical protein
MGRAGIEPATLGLKVDVSVSGTLGIAEFERFVEPIQFEETRVVRRGLVDPMLTRGVD